MGGLPNLIVAEGMLCNLAKNGPCRPMPDYLREYLQPPPPLGLPLCFEPRVAFILLTFMIACGGICWVLVRRARVIYHAAIRRRLPAPDGTPDLELGLLNVADEVLGNNVQ